MSGFGGPVSAREGLWELGGHPCRHRACSRLSYSHPSICCPAGSLPLETVNQVRNPLSAGLQMHVDLGTLDLARNVTRAQY